MIFNIFAGIQVALVAVPAGLAYAIVHYGLGWDTGSWWAAMVGVVCLVPLDLLSRLMAVGGDEGGVDEDGNVVEATEGHGIMAFVWPSAGGHLMFIPMYVLGTLATVGLAMGTLNP